VLENKSEIIPQKKTQEKISTTKKSGKKDRNLSLCVCNLLIPTFLKEKKNPIKKHRILALKSFSGKELCSL